MRINLLTPILMMNKYKVIRYPVENGADVEDAFFAVIHSHIEYNRKTHEWQKNRLQKPKKLLIYLPKIILFFPKNSKTKKNKTLSQKEINIIRKCGLVR